MEVLLLLIGLFTGASVALIATRKGIRDKNTTIEERDRRIGETEAEIATLEVRLEAERQAGRDRLEAIEEAQKGAAAILQQSAEKAMSERGQEVIELLKRELTTTKVEADGDLERRQRQIDETLKPVKELLAKMGSSLEELDRDRRKSHTELSTQIGGLADAQRELRSEASTLSKALRQPHTRGRWGETHMRRLVEMAGMSGHCDFTEQVTVDGDEGALRPDVVFHLPLSRDVVTDCKAPLSPFMDACEAEDEKARAAHMKLYARGLRAHVKKLASKDYSDQFDDAPDFVVMYLPGDHFLDEAMAVDRDLYDDALSKKVLIATPSSMIAMLKTIAHVWQQQRAAEEREEILTVARELYKRMAVHLEHLDKVGTRLNSLVDAHNKSVGSLERRVLPTARRLPELGAVPADSQLPSPRDVPATARRVQAPELEAGPEDEDREAA